MVPILDMINHRNGKWFNVEHTSTHIGEDVRVFAYRDIAKGEQLHNSYNECYEETCSFGAIKYDYVTQHILKDYGFVEAYPRRFLFHVDANGEEYDEDQYLSVEIDEDSEDPSKRVFDWHFLTPSEAQLQWIRRQLKHLLSVEEEVEKGAEELTSEHEKNTILTFHRAYKEAFELSLIHKDDPVSTKTTYEIFDDEDYDENGEEL